MTALVWDQVGERIYQTGVDRGVLYLRDGTAVVWNGLTSVEDNTLKELSEHYLNGVKYLQYINPGDFSASLKAYTYPVEFDDVNGIYRAAPGFHVHEQPPRSFCLSYRTKVGDDIDGLEAGYIIHLLYNILASPDASEYATENEQTNPIEFGWALTAVPVRSSNTWRPTAHFSIESREVSPEILQSIEDILYGTEDTDARFPSISELAEIFGISSLTTLLVAGFDSDTTIQLAISDDESTWNTFTPLGVGGYGSGCMRRESDNALIVFGRGSDGSQLAISTDNGLTWNTYSPFGSGGSGTSCIIRESDGALIVTGFDWPGESIQLAISTDDGATWDTFSPFGDGDGNSCIIRESDGALIVSGTSLDNSIQLAISTDDGATWDTFSPFGSDAIANNCVIRESDNALIVEGYDISASTSKIGISTDDGVTWDTFNPFGDGAGSGICCVNPVDNSIIATGFNTDGSIQLAISTDDGATWNTFSPFGSNGGSTSCIVRESDNALIVTGYDSDGTIQLAINDGESTTWNTFSPFGESGYAYGCFIG